MPKLLPDEKLFPAETLAALRTLCVRCQQPYGSHKFGGANCPVLTGAPGFCAETFLEMKASVIVNQPPVDPCGERLIPDGTLRPVKSNDYNWPQFAVGTVVNFGKLAAPQTGTIVEVVPAGKLPTTPGLRHIADKRRTPKPRDCVSYVVEISEVAARNDLNKVIPKRDRLFWPNTFSVKAV
jgi:hypothetical protein